MDCNLGTVLDWALLGGWTLEMIQKKYGDHDYFGGECDSDWSAHICSQSAAILFFYYDGIGH